MGNAHKYVYLFSEGNGSMRELLGGKGANLAEMTNLGMPVPQGFTVTTEACTQYYNDGRQINEEIQAQIYEYLGKMEEICGKKFADPANPLLVSVRSGARASMPGMEARAPERTETSRGFLSSPNFLPLISSILTRAASICSWMSAPMVLPSS